MLIFIVLQKVHLAWKKELRRKQLRVDHVLPSTKEAGVEKTTGHTETLMTRGA